MSRRASVPRCLRNVWSTALAAALALAAGPVLAQHGPHGGRHGNPADLDAYMERLMDPERDAWQRPAEVVAALGLRPGDVACDVGAGPGYFALRLAGALGPAGRVFAVDVEPAILEALRREIDASGARNVTPVLGLPQDPLLPTATCDVILVVNTYHHFPEPRDYLGRLAEALAPGGRLANVDFHGRSFPESGGPSHIVSREQFLADAVAAGYALLREESFLEHQYFVLLERR